MPKSFSSEIIIYINEPSFFSSFYIQRSFIKIPKSFQRISVNKSPHVFKKSKERFIVHKPTKIHIITPFFSNISLINSFLKAIIKYLFHISCTIQIKVINKTTFKLILFVFLKKLLRKVAQWLEQKLIKLLVVGSNPSFLNTLIYILIIKILISV